MALPPLSISAGGGTSATGAMKTEVTLPFNDSGFSVNYGSGGTIAASTAAGLGTPANSLGAAALPRGLVLLVLGFVLWKALR